MFPQKPKRKLKRRDRRHSWQRWFLILLIALPGSFLVLHPAVGQSLFADGIALSVMLCAAVYIVYQAVVYLIAAYIGVLDEDDFSSQIQE